MQQNLFKKISSGPAAWMLCFGLAIHFILGIFAINRDNITADEIDHLNYGVAILKREPGRRDTAQDFSSTMPVSVVNALPRALEQVLRPGLQKNDFGKEDTYRGRYVTLLFSLLLIIVIFLFAKQLAAPWAAGIIALMAAVDPNFLAHGHLVTTDIFAALAFISTIYFLYRWQLQHRRKAFYYWCIAIALAQCCKMNNILLYPACLIVILLCSNSFALSKKRVGDLAFFVMVQLLVINIAFLFEGTGTYLHAANFSSQKIRNLVSLVPFDFPIPIPLPYLDGFDRMYLEIETGKGLYNNYLLGEIRMAKAFPNYFWVCWHLKTPILTILLIYGALVIAVMRFKAYKKQFLFLVVPACLVFAMISLAEVQNGYRYAMTVTALLFPLAAVAIAEIRWKALQLIVPAVALVTTFSWAPDFIPYTNALVWNKVNAYHFFADSNLNWRQNDDRLAAWAGSNPGVLIDPKTPVKGLIVVDINKLTGADPTYDLGWLRKVHQPTGHLWHSHLIYDLR